MIPTGSRQVTSPQNGPHPRLATLVQRHAATPFRRPVADTSRLAFDVLLARLSGTAACIVDAGCGTGASTAALARMHPDCIVAGIDKSAHRLARAPRDLPENALVLRADMVDIWLLLAAHRIKVAAQYLLYPNPWPKPAQLMRRWPAHPIFPTMVRLGGPIECRSNWRVYVEEFALAAAAVDGTRAEVTELADAVAISPFERKYRASGHRLYTVTLSPRLP
ncbi:MAG: tRNA (guanine(46)-N(7))-methyltransferase TrmB [Burkholderiales bacterium]